MQRKSIVRSVFTAGILAVLVPIAGCGDYGGGTSAGGGGGAVTISPAASRRLALELPSGGTWINSAGPLALADLRGKVVWLEFSFLH